MKFFPIPVFLFWLLSGLLPVSVCSSQEAVTTIYLVRHAEKVYDDSVDPELTDIGKARAKHLDFVLSDIAVEALYATDFIRTRETLQPIAQRRSIPVQLYRHRDNASVQDMLDDIRGKTAVISGHSNTIPELVNRIIGEAKYTMIPDNEHSKLFLIVLEGDRVVKCEVLHY
jgi:phosphohistidine phosphatase SixA